MKKLFKFFREIFSEKEQVHTLTITSVPKIPATEMIANYIITRSGGVVGAVGVRHPSDRMVVIFDIIIPRKDGKEGKMLQLELFNQIEEGTYKEKIDQFLEDHLNK